MFTSRAEYRLFLRQDNAEERLMSKGRILGLVDDDAFRKFEMSRMKKDAVLAKLAKTKIRKEEINSYLLSKGKRECRESEYALDLLRRPEIRLEEIIALLNWDENLNFRELQSIESHILYSGYFERQNRDIERSKKLSHLRIPPDFDFMSAKSMRLEARQTLLQKRPLTVGAASKLAGVSPADISGLIFHIKYGSAKGTM